MTFILTHIGRNNVPEYSKIAIEQIRKFNPVSTTHFLTKFPSSPKITELNKLIKYRDTTGLLQDFWIVTTKRLFVIELYMKDKNLQNVIHIENDNLVYEDFNKFESIFRENYKVGIVPISKTHASAGIMFIRSYKDLQLITDFILEELKQKKFKSEMVSLRKVKVDYLPTLPNNKEYSNNIDKFDSLFDGATWGQYIGGIYKPYSNTITKPMTNDSLPKSHEISKHINKYKIQWIDKIPYIIDKDKKWKLNNLHLHCKKLKDFI